MIFPSTRTITEGSCLAIVAPAGPFDRVAFEKGVTWLRNRYEITYDPNIFSRCGYFAGNDERRLNELLSAIDDPEVDGILCARGGYGATRLLPGIDLDRIRAANKTIVGFSDITALHAAWARAGVRSIHAPMVSVLGNAPDEIRQTWIRTLEGEEKNYRQSLDPIVCGKAQGRLFGGNLAVLCSLLGTPYAAPLDDVILFIEDVGERPYRMDRMLTTIQQAGWFEKISGLILGQFTEGEPGTDGVTLDEVFESHFDSASFPVLRGMSSGHITDNYPLTLGAEARIENQSFEIVS